MKINKILASKFAISFEFFPPKTEAGEKSLDQTLRNLAPMKPDFVSITYGAGGSTRDKTREIAIRMVREIGLNVMAHLTCIGHTKEEVLKILQQYQSNGIDNILALRGDIPVGSHLKAEEGELPHAIDLVRLIRSHFNDGFSIGGASFPECHPESADMTSELKHFKSKAEAGLNFSITQLFFDNQHYFDYVRQCRAKGITLPVLPGIMPITNFRQIKRFAELSHASIPKTLIARLEPHENNDPEVSRIGIEYAIQQCRDLIRGGAPGLHFYTLNSSTATLEIHDAIRNELPLASAFSYPPHHHHEQANLI